MLDERRLQKSCIEAKLTVIDDLHLGLYKSMHHLSPVACHQHLHPASVFGGYRGFDCRLRMPQVGQQEI